MPPTRGEILKNKEEKIMANEKSRNAKRIASGALALAIVASQVLLPANVEWGGLLKSSTITASADDSSIEFTISEVGENQSRDYFSDPITVTGTGGYRGGFLVNKSHTITVSNSQANYVIKSVELTLYYSSGTDTYVGSGNVSYTVADSGTVSTSDSTVTISNVYSNSVSIRNTDKYDDGIEVAKVKVYYAEMSAPTVSATQDLAWTGSAQALVQAPENASIKFRYKKSTDDAYSDWSTTVPSAADVGSYDVQWYSEKNTYYLESGTADDPNHLTVTVNPATTELAPENYTMLHSTYNAKDQSLVTLKENAASVVNIGTAQYAVGKEAKNVIGNDGSSADNLTTDNISVDRVFNPLGIGGFNFPAGYSLKVGNTTYEPNGASGYVNYYLNGSGSHAIMANGGVDTDLPAGTNAFLITGIDEERQIITGKFVYVDSSATYYITTDSWKNTIPTAKDAGAYPVFVKVDADDNYSALAPTPLGTATIAKANLSVKANENLKYNGTAQELVTAPAGAEVKYATVKYTVITGLANERKLNANDIKEGNIYKPSSDYGFFFPENYSMEIGDDTYLPNPTSNTINLYYWQNKYQFSHGSGSAVEFTSEADSLLITGIDTENKVLTAEIVKASDYEGKYMWSETTTVPQKTNAGTYTVYYRTEGNNNYNSAEGSVDVTIAKANLTAGTDYTAPTIKTEKEGLNYLYFNDKDQALIKEGSLRENINPTDAGENDKVKIEYGILGSKEGGKVIECASAASLSEDDVAIGNIYKPTGEYGVFFPSGYTVMYNEAEHKGYGNNSVNISYYIYRSPHYYLDSDKTITSYPGIPLPNGCDAVKVTTIDKGNKVITIEAVNAEPESVDWKDTVPTAKDVGEYDVYYRIQGGANYENVAPTKIGTAKIDYKPISLTVSNLGNVKVAEYDYATKEETPVTATGNQYTLKASKTYKIYTEKSINEALETKYGLSRKTLKTGDYKYVYTITLPEVPDAEDYPNDAFTLSHTNNYQGKVLESDETKLYVADGDVNVTDETIPAATLEGKSTYYYGDTPEFDDVKIEMPNLVKVKDIYLADSTGAKVDLTSANVKYGEYNLTAILTIDNDGDNNFDTKDGQLTETLRREVTFAPRPMSENTYYLKTTNDQGVETLKPLAVKYAKAKAAGTDSGSGSGSGSGTGIAVGISGGTPVETPIGNTEPELDLTDLKDTADKTYKYPVVVVPENTYTYNSEDQKPDIVVKNPSLGKSETNPDGTALVIKSETADGEYTSAVTAHKDAGTYSEKITAVPSVKDEGNNVITQANYTGDVTVVWTINKAKANVTVAAKNNIVYDGKNLDGDDFDVKAAAGSEDNALTKEFLSTIGVKDSGTTFEVSAAKVDVATKTDYTADEMTSAEGVTVNYDNIDSYVNKVINGDLNVEFTKGQPTKSLTVMRNVATIKIYNNNNEYDASFVFVSNNATLTYGEDGSLTIDGYKFVPDNGYRLKISNFSRTLDTTEYNMEIMEIHLDTVPEKKTTTELKASKLSRAKTLRILFTSRHLNRTALLTHLLQIIRLQQL